MNTRTDRTSTETEGISGLLVRLSSLALVTAIANKARAAADAIAASRAIGPNLRDCVMTCKGLFVAPDVHPGALILSEACSGVFMARSVDGNDWNGPTFHVLGGVTLDVQLGEHPSSIFLVAMTDRGVNAFVSSDIGGPDGPRIWASSGRDEEAGAVNDADILGFALSEDACFRPSLTGAVISACDGLNHAVYGREVTLSDVLIRGQARSVGSVGLARSLFDSAV